jgi:hypothetical protein
MWFEMSLATKSGVGSVIEDVQKMKLSYFIAAFFVALMCLVVSGTFVSLCSCFSPFPFFGLRLFGMHAPTEGPFAGLACTIVHIAPFSIHYPNDSDRDGAFRLLRQCW